MPQQVMVAAHAKTHSHGDMQNHANKANAWTSTHLQFKQITIISIVYHQSRNRNRNSNRTLIIYHLTYHIASYHIIPVVPHKAVAEASQ